MDTEKTLADIFNSLSDKDKKEIARELNAKIPNFSKFSTEELRILKNEITKELSRRHKAKEDEKCSCWTCGHCFYDSNAHISWSRLSDRGGYKCMACGKHGKIIPTKHKAPVWCPLKGDKDV